MASLGLPRHVKALALCHKSGAILASHLHWDRDGERISEYEATLHRIFASAGWRGAVTAERRKLELREDDNLYCIEMDDRGRVYVAIVSAGFPTRVVFSSSASNSAAAGAGAAPAAPGDPRLMAEFAAHVTATFRQESLASPEKGLQRSLRPFLRALAARFDDLEGLGDRITTTAAKTEALKEKLAKTLVLADERASLLSDVQEKSEELADGARSLFTTARRMRTAQRWARCRASLWVVLCCAGVAGVLALVLGLGFGVFHWGSGTASSSSTQQTPAPASAAAAAALYSGSGSSSSSSSSFGSDSALRLAALASAGGASSAQALFSSPQQLQLASSLRGRHR
jgi:hypothetical protein